MPRKQNIQNANRVIRVQDNTKAAEDVHHRHRVVTKTPEPLHDHKDDSEAGTLLVDASSKDSIATTEEMDEMLERCFQYAIKDSLDQRDLPVPTSTFYSVHMMKYCQEGRQLDIKKSSYKKLSKFLKRQEKTGIIKVKELSKGNESIIKVDKSHLMLQELKVPDPVEKKTSSDNNTKTPPLVSVPVITESFEITAVVLPLFKSLGYSEGDLVKKMDVRKVLKDYVRGNDLDLEDSERTCIQDPLLAGILFNGDEDKTKLTLVDVFSRLLSKMVPVYEIKTEGKPPVIKKGNIGPVKIDVIERAPDKQITTVEKLDEFGIDLEEFCQTVHTKLACGANVTSAEEKSGLHQVVIQGNKTDAVRDLLMDHYKIPSPSKHFTHISHDEYEVVPKVISKSEEITDKKIQYSNRNCLHISGVPETAGEDTAELVINIARDLNVCIRKADVEHCDRALEARDGFNRAIFVAFSSGAAYQGMFSKRKNLRKLEQWDGVYIHEYLTPHQCHIMYQARKYVHEHLIKAAFTSYGKVYVRDLSGKKHQIIDAEELTVFGILQTLEP